MTVPEPNGPAQICITMTGRTTVPITVTAMTGPKSGAPDQAIGSIFVVLFIHHLGGACHHLRDITFSIMHAYTCTINQFCCLTSISITKSIVRDEIAIS